jgi:hypothetical protein
MEKRSVGAIAAGIIVVVVIAMILRPPAAVMAIVAPTPTPTPTPPPTLPTIPTPVPTTVQTPIRIAAPGEVKVETREIGFTARPWEYPLYQLPDDLVVFGASDVSWRFNDSVVFSYINGTRGGVTNRFTVHYPTWRIVCRTSSDAWPEFARLRLAVIDNSTGGVINGIDLQYPGTASRVIRTYDREFYLIVAADHLDRYTITLEAPTELIRRFD